MGLFRQFRTAIREALASALAARTQYLRHSFVVVLFLLSGASWCAGQIAAADIISPPIGSTLGSTVNFTWGGGQGVTEYILGVGSQWGSRDIFDKSVGLATSQEVSGLPTNGMLLYVEICSVWGPSSAACTIYPYQSAGAFKLDKCSCADVPQLQDRLQKLQGIEALVANKAAATVAGTPASQQQWAALQTQIKNFLTALQIQNLTAFPDTSLFSGKDDPACVQILSGGASCMDQDYTLHQLAHQASCSAQRWRWQTPWDEISMLGEEAAGLEKEVSAIQETIKHMGCGLNNGSVTAPPVQQNPPNQTGACPQFMVVVQTVTTSTINVPGALNEHSSRSLNNGQGILVPLIFHDDGTFEGFGAGSDSGSVMGAGPGEVVNGQFGHSQSIAASGFIRPGSCNTQPCQPDVMHLVLVGGPSQQMSQLQARGALNRDINQNTPTNGARLEFDLPAYIGGSAQRTFFASAMLNSGMTVNLVQGNNGTPALPQGSSLLYAQQQCKAGSRAPAPGGGGGIGVVIPGLEGNVPSTGGNPR